MTITTLERTSLIELTVIMFNAPPGAKYLADLTAAYEANGHNLEQLADSLSALSSYKVLNPDSQTPAQFAAAFLTPLGLQGNAYSTNYIITNLAAGVSKGEIAYQCMIALESTNRPEYADAKAILANKITVSEYFTVTQAVVELNIPPLQQVIAGVTSNHSTVVSAEAAIDAAIAGGTFGTSVDLTTSVDNIAGTSGNDTFNGTYNAGVVTDTLNTNDIIAAGGGTDTLHISHVIDVAITPPDSLWTGLSGIEKIEFVTSGSGAQTLTTGSAFQHAFAQGVDLSMVTTGAGAISINMDGFSAAAKVTAVSTAGAIVISGAHLTQVDATTTGAGAQTITSTGSNNVTINATSADGATTVVTGGGNDAINLIASAAGGLNTITAGPGADAINLVTGAFAAKDTLVQADGASMAATANTTTSFITAGQTISFGNGLDVVHGFNGAVDVLNVGTPGVALSGIGLNEAAFTATATIYLSGSYAAGTGVFTIAANGAGADTLVLDTTVGADQNIATADTWIMLVGTSSASFNAGTFI